MTVTSKDYKKMFYNKNFLTAFLHDMKLKNYVHNFWCPQQYLKRNQDYNHDISGLLDKCIFQYNNVSHRYIKIPVTSNLQKIKWHSYTLLSYRKLGVHQCGVQL